MKYVKKYLISGGILLTFMILAGILSMIPNEEFYQGVFFGMTAQCVSKHGILCCGDTSKEKSIMIRRIL